MICSIFRQTALIVPGPLLHVLRWFQRTSFHLSFKKCPHVLHYNPQHTCVHLKKNFKSLAIQSKSRICIVFTLWTFEDSHVFPIILHAGQHLWLRSWSLHCLLLLCYVLFLLSCLFKSSQPHLSFFPEAFLMSFRLYRSFPRFSALKKQNAVPWVYWASDLRKPAYLLSCTFHLF